MIPVVILAGGKGTRLQKMLDKSTPKPMAQIAGKPFLWWLVTYLQMQGFSEFYISIGFLKDRIVNYFGNEFGAAKIDYIIEEEPLGTGGAIKYACEKINSDLLVINGDTFSTIDFLQFIDQARDSNVVLSMALIKASDSSRYGSVNIDLNGRVACFSEKSASNSVYLNAGIYYLSKNIIKVLPKEKVFSFEKDFIERSIGLVDIGGLSLVSDFIDIGIPEDFLLAQRKIPSMLQNDVLNNGNAA